MKNRTKNKIIKPMLLIASLTIGLGLTSCEKECLSDFKKEISKCDSNASDTLSTREVNMK